MGTQIVRYGKIYAISDDEKGFKRLVIRCSEKFKMKFIIFCLLNDKDLQCDGITIRVNDKVEVSYRYNLNYGNFAVLVSLKHTPPELLSCGRCFMYYFPTVKARVTRSCLKCPHCIDDKIPKGLIHFSLSLSYKVLKSFPFLNGLYLKFNSSSTEQYHSIVFEGSPLFNQILKSETSQVFKIIAWENSRILKSNYCIRFIDIFEIQNM